MLRVAKVDSTINYVGVDQPNQEPAPIEDVIQLFQEWSDSCPNDYLSRTQLGQALSAQAREHADLLGYETAEVVLNEALAINPQWKPAQPSLAGVLHSQHRFVEARVIAQRLVDEDSNSLSGLALLGDANLELGDLATAFAAAAIGDHERAARLYETPLASGPAPDLFGLYADVLFALGQPVEAAEQEALGMALAVETMDRFPAERRHLVSFLATRDSATAVELARADLADRQDWGAYDTLAWARYHDGRAAEGARALSLAPASDPP